MENIVIIGQGGREHSLGDKLSQSSEISHIFYSQGNAGTEEGKGINLFLDGTKKENFGKLYDFVMHANIKTIIVGSEIPSSDGIVNFFHSKKYYNIFAPTREAACLETDKFFSYDLMSALRISQADSVKCFSIEEAIKAIKKRPKNGGVVIKARGLTGGKGVTVCESIKHALHKVKEHCNAYGFENLIAERLYGDEFSVFGISDGKTVCPIEISVQDHKRLLDGNKGINTGGMGSYSPVAFAQSSVVRNINEHIMKPVVQKMKEIGYEYKGFLYAGMIMTKDGPKVLEFNARLGDPECQSLMMMLKNDFYIPIKLALEGEIKNYKIEFNPGASCCLALTARGYPDNKSETYQKSQGLEIMGINEADKIKGVKVFHGGTIRFEETIRVNGGRILYPTSYSENGIAQAQKLAYEAASKIYVSGGFYWRRDIADKAIKN